MASGDNSDIIIPNHIGFIMDGNRRWAKAKNLPTLEGHRRGFNKVNELVDNCIEMGIKHVTVWAFSTENWNRSEAEIKYLMNLFREMFEKYHKNMKKKGVRILVQGRLTDFPDDVQEKAAIATAETADNDRLILNIAMSYGGRAEIVDMMKGILADNLSSADITEELLSQYIYEKEQPDLDMIVRTSGEQRHSGFMLWQSAYAEYMWVEECWPDFDKQSLMEVLSEYSRRERRYGK